MAKSAKQGARKRVKVTNLPAAKKRATAKDLKKIKGGMGDGSVRNLKQIGYLEQGPLYKTSN